MGKKKLLAAIFLTLLLAGCSLPKRGATSTATPDLVATKVEQILTALPTKTNLPITSTPAQPTLTLTPQVSVTPTATITPTDSHLGLGAPTWEEKYTSNIGSFQEMDNGHTRITFANQALQISANNPDGWLGWNHNYRTKAVNFYLEITFIPQTCSGNDEYGITFRSPDYNQGYFLGISCDGKYMLSVWDGSNSSELIKWTANPALAAGSNQTNRIAIKAVGSHLSFYANGKSLQDFDDSTYTNEGTAGLFITSHQTPDFTVSVTDLSFWNLP
jgi:hypothetical protein